MGIGIGNESVKSKFEIWGRAELKLEKIVAIAHPENIAWRQVMEKVGMKYEKEADYYHTNVVYYAISSKEYQHDSLLYVLQR